MEFSDGGFHFKLSGIIDQTLDFADRRLEANSHVRICTRDVGRRYRCVDETIVSVLKFRNIDIEDFL